MNGEKDQYGPDIERLIELDLGRREL